MTLGSDDSLFIDRAIDKVWVTLAEAAVLVVLVIYLFLGSWRATLIPAITVPLCLLASFAVLCPGDDDELSALDGQFARHPVAALLDQAVGAELLVMPRGRSACAVAEYAQCPVAVV